MSVRGASSRLTVATWNLQNFAQPRGGTSAPFVQKRDFIAEALAASDADVIALQELLDEHTAAHVAKALNRRVGADVYSAVNGQPDPRGNRVAFVSRVPIVALASLSTWHLSSHAPVLRLERVAGHIVTVEEPTLPRPPLHARVRLAEGTTIDIINVHLKSKLLALPGGGHSTEDATLHALAQSLCMKRREAEAATVRAHVDELLAIGHHVIVLGDFNDGPDATTTQHICGLDRGSAQRLHNVTLHLPPEHRWSRTRDGQRELLDQILVSEGLAMHEVHAHHHHVSDHALVHATTE